MQPPIVNHRGTSRAPASRTVRASARSPEQPNRPVRGFHLGTCAAGERVNGLTESRVTAVARQLRNQSRTRWHADTYLSRSFDPSLLSLYSPVSMYCPVPSPSAIRYSAACAHSSQTQGPGCPAGFRHTRHETNALRLHVSGLQHDRAAGSNIMRGGCALKLIIHVGHNKTLFNLRKLSCSPSRLRASLITLTALPAKPAKPRKINEHRPRDKGRAGKTMGALTTHNAQKEDRQFHERGYAGPRLTRPSPDAQRLSMFFFDRSLLSRTVKTAPYEHVEHALNRPAMPRAHARSERCRRHHLTQHVTRATHQRCAHGYAGSTPARRASYLV